MKIKCEYCESMFDDTLENCPACGAPNKNVRRSTPDQPTTIDGLLQWYAAMGLPPEEVTRFFIGKNITEPKAFGIYKDERSGKFIVYKNKADGSRAVRYEGTDEAYAVNELQTRLKQEILEQKAHNGSNRNGSRSGSSGSSRRRKKSGGLASWIVMLIVLGPVFIGMWLGLAPKKYAKVGYYSYNNNLYYHLTESDKLNWGVYDEEKNTWKEPWLTPNPLESRSKAKKYFLSEDYNPAYGGEDIKNSIFYDDYLNGFNVTTGYYAYGDDIYYHMKDRYDEGWYIYNEDADDDWTYATKTSVPADLMHQSVAQNFWYTPNWDSETQMSDFEESDDWQEYQEDLARQAAYEAEQRDNDSDSDYSWDSGDSWDSGSTDWDSDW